MAKRVKDYLTGRQKEILEFIQEFRDAKGLSPTHREICEKFGYSSYGTVYKHLKLLEQKGFLRRDQNQKRGIELVRSAPSPGKKRSDSVSPSRSAPHPSIPVPSERELPFLGRIAAGQPIEAVSSDDTLAVPAHLLSARSGEHYVLRVVGDSMVDEGIHDGDYAVVLQRDEAEPGQMVVALVDHEATLKRFFPEGEQVRLQPANPTMEPIYVPARDVKVQGVVVGLMRKF
jgi:repressor LexA